MTFEEEVARLEHLQSLPDWSPEDVAWWLAVDKVIAWDISLNVPGDPQTPETP